MQVSLAMADPLASWMWTRLTEPPPHDGHVLVNMDVLGQAPEDEKVLQPASSDAKVEVRNGGVPEDKKGGYGGSLSWEDEDDAAKDAADDDVPLDDFEGIKTVPVSKDRPWIWRVHPSVREKEQDAYEPKIVSIGPLHNGKETLKPMEAIKRRYVQFLLDRSPTKNNAKNYFKVVRNCEERVRKQYAEVIGMWSRAFKQMLVVDGCFMIEYFLRGYLDERQIEPDELVSVGWDLSHVRRDLMLLENQIPFFVLEELFRESVIPNNKSTVEEPLSLMTIALHFLNIKQLPKDKRPAPDKVHHLLHLQYVCLKPDDLPRAGPLTSSPSVLLFPVKKASSLLSFVFYSLLYVLLINEWPWRPRETEPKQTIPCATELHRFGVQFKSKYVAENEGKSYLNVTFSDGTLEVPFFTVAQTTSSLLRNFIAFERCHTIGNYFTEYAIFMDNIIDTQSDVVILRNYGIIETTLGSDEQVVTTFNSLFEGTHISYKQHSRMDKLFKDVKEYCNIPHHRWQASLKSTHLRSPWATVSLLAGTIGIVTSIIQTYFSITRPHQK